MPPVYTTSITIVFCPPLMHDILDLPLRSAVLLQPRVRNARRDMSFIVGQFVTCLSFQVIQLA